MTLAEKGLSGRFKYVRAEKAGGATFTPRGLSEFVARQIAANVRAPEGRPLRVIDPAVGEGALLLSLLDKLVARGFDKIDVYGFDTNAGSLDIAEDALKERFPFASMRFRVGDFLEYAGQITEQSLFADALTERFDVLIANPPYVRTQIMGASHAQQLASHFGLSGRVDLYQAFILGMIEVLAENAVAGIIVSNRFMTTNSGATVRKALRESVCIRHIWDLGDTRLFEAAVLPAVLLFDKRPVATGKNPSFTSIYETNVPAGGEVQDVVAALDQSGAVAVSDGRRFRVVQGNLDLTSGTADVWRVATNEGDAWLRTVEAHTWRNFGDVGAIRVGIKTCGDKVFINRKWGRMPAAERPELVRPLITHHVGRRFKADYTDGARWVLYPHVMDGGQRVVADLSLYPRTASYLERNRSILESRSYVMEAGRRWYEIWVPQNPAAWHLPKLVFRDICETPTFWIDLEGRVVNGDCYWLALNSGEAMDLLWLAAAVANSSFIESFYDHRFHNKLYAGRRRFMTQYVERFPLPDPATPEATELVHLAKKIYNLTPSAEASALESTLDRLVRRAFGLSVEEVAW